MAISYKDIDELTQKASVGGTEKLPVSDTEYITPAQMYYPGNANRADVDWSANDLSINGSATIKKDVTIQNGGIVDIDHGNAVDINGQNFVGVTIRRSNATSPAFGVAVGLLTYQNNGFYVSGGPSGFSLNSYNNGTFATPFVVVGPSGSHPNCVGIGISDPAQALAVSGNITATGTITPGSDSRIKDKQQEIDGKDALEIIGKLTPKTWTWNDKTDNAGGKAAGLVAQEVAEVIPDAVLVGEGCGFKDFHSLNYNTIQGYELAAIKGLIAEVNALRAEIEELKNKK